MCSKVSIAFIRIIGSGVGLFLRFEMELRGRGKGRLKPQSPLARDDLGVVIERWIGCGRVAVSELKMAVEEISLDVWGRGAGMEKTLDARRRAAPGDTLRVAIVS